MHVHHALHRARNGEQVVAAARHFPESRAYGQDQVRAAHALAQRRVDADADVTAVIRMAVVEQILPAETAGGGKIVRFDKRTNVVACCGRPVTAAQDDERLLRLREQLAHLVEVRHTGMRFDTSIGTRVGSYRLAHQHVLGQ
jgi:hypothetical protein